MKRLWPLAIFIAAACGPASRPPDAPVTTAPTSWTSETEVHRAIVFTPTFPKPVSPSLSASDDIVKLCRLTLDNVAEAPKFASNRSDLLPEDNDVLDRIARCFNEGSLGYVSLELIGHADARGTEEHNLALGTKRAHTVAMALRERGVDESRIFELSRGERDAVGKDEATRATDRRVDIIAFRPLGIEE